MRLTPPELGAGLEGPGYQGVAGARRRRPGSAARARRPRAELRRRVEMEQLGQPPLGAAASRLDGSPEGDLVALRLRLDAELVSFAGKAVSTAVPLLVLGTMRRAPPTRATSASARLGRARGGQRRAQGRVALLSAMDSSAA